jgi:hypothetical protein
MAQRSQIETYAEKNRPPARRHDRAQHDSPELGGPNGISADVT